MRPVIRSKTLRRSNKQQGLQGSFKGGPLPRPTRPTTRFVKQGTLSFSAYKPKIKPPPPPPTGWKGALRQRGRWRRRTTKRACDFIKHSSSEPACGSKKRQAGAAPNSEFIRRKSRPRDSLYDGLVAFLTSGFHSTTVPLQAPMSSGGWPERFPHADGDVLLPEHVWE